VKIRQPTRSALLRRNPMDGANDAGSVREDKSTSPNEEITENLSKYLVNFEELEQQQKSEARAERIESMLERILDNQNKLLQKQAVNGQIEQEKE